MKLLLAVVVAVLGPAAAASADGGSTWPVRAMQSLDFTFVPDGGISGKSGIITVGGAEGPYSESLARHSRKREVWGLDVLEQPGPPMGLSWTISTIPLLGHVSLIVVAWRRTRGTTTAAGT